MSRRWTCRLRPLGLAAALGISLIASALAQVDSTSGGSLTIQVSGSEKMRVDSSGRVGISTTSPIAKLDVNGTISASDAIQVSGSSLTCASSVNGAIRWNSTSNTIQVCAGSIWTSLSSGTTSAGVSAMASLTDVTITNLAGRDYLRYDSGTSKWVNISESTVMSTTTMAAGWPDAIYCYGASGGVYLTNSIVNGSSSRVYSSGWTGSAATDNLYINFNSSGAPTSIVNTGQWAGYYETNCNGASGNTINQLYASGRAFNYIGSTNRWQDVAGFTYLTANNVGIGVTASSTAKFEVLGLISATGATGAVSTTNLSATTATIGTLTGTTGSFGGLTVTGAASISTVSATNVSATILHLTSTTLACTSSISGSMRFNATSNTVQVCASGIWTSLSSNTTGSGVSSMASLTDVTITNIAGRDYLRYDAGTSKWVNISESTVMSTTTMVANFPDAIACSLAGGSDRYWFFLSYVGSEVWYTYPYSANDQALKYNPSTGAYITASGSAPTGTYACNTNLSTIYAAGRAYNFIGGADRWQDVAGFTYLTANNVGIGVTASSTAKFEVLGLISATGATGAVSTTNLSATTATMGALTGTTGSFGGLTVTGTSSLTTVSATNVSATVVHLTSTTLACTSSISGSIRFNATSNTVQVCASNVWTSLSSGTATASTAGATTQVQYNNNGALGADANFTYASATGAVSATRVSATTVSGTDIQVGGGGACSASGHAGKVKWSGAEMQYCDGSAWTSLAQSGGGGSGTLVYKRYSSLLVSGVAYNGITPTNTYTIPVTLPGNTWAVLIGVTYAHGGTTDHGYWSFDAYQQGASSSTQKASYYGQHYDDYYNTDYTEITVPWTGGGNNSITIQTTYSYNTNASNVYDVKFVGYLAGNPSNDNLGNHIATQGLNMNGYSVTNTLQVSTTNISATNAHVSTLGVGLTNPTSALQVSGTFTVSSTVTGITPSLFVNSSGYVGVNDSNPTNPLTLHQSANTTSATGSTYPFLLRNQGSTVFTLGSDATNLYLTTWASRKINLDGQGNAILLNPTSGNVGVGTSSPDAKLTVSGQVSINSGDLNDSGIASYANGNACWSTVSANVTGYYALGGCSSDRRLKDDISYITQPALPLIMNLKPVRYVLKDDKSKVVKAGFIAQDTTPFMPEATPKNSDGFFGWDSNAVLSYVVKGMQELKAANDNLLSKATVLEAQLKAANDNHAQDSSAIEKLRNELRDLKNDTEVKKTGTR